MNGIPLATLRETESALNPQKGVPLTVKHRQSFYAIYLGIWKIAIFFGRMKERKGRGITG